MALGAQLQLNLLLQQPLPTPPPDGLMLPLGWLSWQHNASVARWAVGVGHTGRARTPAVC